MPGWPSWGSSGRLTWWLDSEALTMRVHLGGHLSWYDPQKRSWLALSKPAPIPLLDLVRTLGVPAAEIAVAVINGQAVELETGVATDGDKVEFFPPLGGG